MPRNILQDKKIDRYNLEADCENQPSFYHYWARKFAEAKESRDFAKANYEKTMSRISLLYRSGELTTPISADGKPIKLSEATISSLVSLHADVCVAQADFFKAEKELLIAKANEETMQQRRSALNNLIELYTKEYYAPTHEGKNPSRTKEDIGADGQRKNLNKKKKEA